MNINPLTPLGGGAFAGGITGCVTTPLDVITTQVHLTPIHTERMDSGGCTTEERLTFADSCLIEPGRKPPFEHCSNRGGVRV